MRLSRWCSHLISLILKTFVTVENEQRSSMRKILINIVYFGLPVPYGEKISGYTQRLYDLEREI